ncbi:phage tail tape measure protein [Bacillus subtilis]|nr:MULTISPECIES: phage tail tape measure protein [Bacillus]AYK58345.1 phage tail tape measure protein [Bacillus subtilis subsp. subtilis]MDN4182242.1 phage tail tape measure protein [Bacillus subtilis]WBC25926.1 phage tail tape measure protein [Bacillus subtilis]
MAEGVVIKVGLDGTKVTQSLKAIKNTVAASTSQWKAEFQIFKNAGDQLGMLGAKYDGLSRTIKIQDVQVKKLTESYNKAIEKYGKNTEEAMRFANQINNTTRRQALYRQELKDTEIAMNDQKRGTSLVRENLSLLTRETTAAINKFKAQGKALRANKEEYKGLGNQIKERNQLIEKEKLKLQELIEKKGADNIATKKQRTAILELEAAQASAVSRYKTLNRQVGSSSKLSLTFRDNVNKLRDSVNRASDKLTSAGHSMTTATFGIGGAFVYGTKQAVEFERKMTDIKSLLESDGESAKEAGEITKDMEKQATVLSGKYGISVQKIGDAYETMIRKGDTGRQAIAAVEKMIKASTAAGSEFKETTKVSMNVMEQFFDKSKSAAKTAENTTRVTNAMAYAADHGSAKFTELGYSMNYVGDYAKSVGYSMEDMAAYLEVMSRRGVEGTSAGTGLRGVMASLVKPSKQAAGAMADIGLKTSDSHGNLLRLSAIVEQLREKTKGMGTEEKGNLLSRMFGRTSLPTITALMTESGEHLDKFSAKIKNAEKTDYAGTVTNRMMKSGKKQLDIFKETSKNFAMEVSATLLPSVTSLVKHLNKLLVKFENLSPETKKTIGTVAALTAVFAPLAIGLGAVFKAISITTSGLMGLGRAVSFVAKSPFTFFKNARLEGTKTNKVLKGIGKGFKWTGKLAWGGVKKTGSAIKIFGKGIGKAFKWTGKLAWSGVKKTGSLIKIFGKGIGKAFKWTGKLAWSGVKAAGRGITASGKAIGKSFKWTARLAATGIKKTIVGIGVASKATARGIKTMTKASLSFAKTGSIWVAQKVKILAVATAQRVATASTKAWAVAQRVLNVALKANPIGLVITAIGLLVAAVIYSYKHFKGFRKVVDSVWSGVKKTFSSSVKYCKKLFTSLSKNFGDTWGDIKDEFNSATKLIKSILKTFSDFFHGRWDKLWDDCKSIVKNGVKLVKSQFKAGFNFLNKITGGTLGKMWKKVSKVGGDIISFFKKLPGKMADGIKSGAKALGNAGIFVGNKLIDGVESVTNGVIGGVNWVLKKVDMPTIDDVKMKHIPYFAKGTWQGDPNAFAGGLAHVGDGGKHELMRFPNGEMALSPNTDTIVNLPRGTSILGGDKTEQLMKSGALPKFSIGTWLGSAKDFIKGGWSKLKDIGSNIYDYLSDPTKLLNTVVSKFAGSALGKLGGSILDMGKGIIKKIISGVKDKLTDFASGGVDTGDVKVSGSLKSWVKKGMKIAGVSGAAWEKGLETIAIHESGGTAGSHVNKWDSNWRAGHPSAGLMQMVETTFASHAKAGHKQWLNPIDQVASAIGYIQSRYHGIANVPGIKALAHGRKYVGYATGTDHHNGGPAVLGDGGQREPYLTPQGQFGVSPSVPTLFANLPKGTKVWPSIKAFKEQVGHFAKGTNEVWVDGYYRSNGTYVKGYWRKKPESHSTKSGSSKKTKTKTIIKYVTRPAANNKTLSKEAKKQKAAAAAKKKAAELSKKISDSISTIITDYRAGKISAKTERARLEAIQKNHKLTATQRNRIVAAIGASSKAIAKQISSYNNAIGNAINKFDSTMKTIRTTYNNAVADAKKTYQSAVNENRNTAYTSFAMFDKAEQSKVSGVGLLRNLKSQNSLYKKFTSNIKKLQRRGASKKMINELLQQGPSANADVEALLSLSTSDWKSYKGAYSEKTKTANALGDLTTSFGGAKTDLNKALKTAKAKYQSSVNDAVNTLGNAMKSANKKYRSTGVTLSGHFVSGIVNGLKKSQKDVSSAAEKIAHNIENSIRKRLDIHSPSRVAVRLMGFFGEGLVNGLTGSITNVSRAALHVSDSITKNIIPIDGTAAVENLQAVAAAAARKTQQSNQSSGKNDELLTKLLLAQERTNQLLAQLLIGQGANQNNGAADLKTIANLLNGINGNALGLNTFMQGGKP